MAAVAVARLGAGCAGLASPGSSAASTTASTSAATASATASTASVPAGTTGGIVILLQELVGATSRGAGLPLYRQYPFALFPDGRAFWERWTNSSSAGRMLQADLTAEEVELLRGWVREAQLGTVDKEYPPAGDAVSQILLLTVRDGDTRSEVKLWMNLPHSYPPTCPASLVRFLDRLSSFSAAGQMPFRPERIEIMVTEKNKQTDLGLPLPPELDPATMEVAWRSEERVVYVKSFSGAEAKRLEELIDRQHSFDDARRSYDVSYRPLDLPQP